MRSDFPSQGIESASEKSGLANLYWADMTAALDGECSFINGGAPRFWAVPMSIDETLAIATAFAPDLPEDRGC